MRNLTIKRTKRLVGCLSKIKVYIEDPASNELYINQIPCRKLGDLKNGEEKTFQIPNEAAKVFVVADKLSRNISNEYYQLAEGDDDIFLSGQNKMNLAGNAFRFDNNESEAVIANRKKSVKRSAWVLIAAFFIGIVIGFPIGFLSIQPQKKDFSAQGMTITLTDEFRQVEVENFTVAYDSAKLTVYASKIDILEAPLAEVAEVFATHSGLTPDDVKTTDGLTYFTYTNISSKNNVKYQYTVCVYQNNDTFWVIQFAIAAKDADDYADKITEWAKSVRFE